MTVRPAGVADALALARVEQACFANPWSQRALADTLGQPGALFVLAEQEDGTVVGYAGCQCVLDEGYVTNIAVVPALRRQGVARKLLCWLLTQVAGRLSFITLEVRDSNRAAISLYEQMGFCRVGVRKAYYTDPVEDAQLWTKELGERNCEHTGH